MEKEFKKLKKSIDGKEYLTDGNFIYVKNGEELIKLAVFDKNFYKLKIWNGIPILEIDGLRMHLVKNFRTPLEYANEVIVELKPRGSILDTCMGLGYTAIQAAKKGKKITTCEISAAVYTLASWNPWSVELFDNKKIEIIRGDIFKEIKEMPDKLFNAVIHDPPRFSKAGELYSLEFYRELYRVCKPKAKIFHYVGSVGKKKGRNIEKEVEKRLEETGFKKIKYKPRLQGLVFER